MAGRLRPSSHPKRAGKGRRGPTKIEIHCPECGASYMIPEETLEKRVQCRRCKRVFVPANLLKKKKRKARGSGVRTSSVVTLLLGMAMVIAAAVIIANQFSEPEKKPEEETVEEYKGPSPEETQVMEAPKEAVEKWVTAVTTREKADLDILTHFPSFYRILPENEKLKDSMGRIKGYESLDPMEKLDAKEKIFKYIFKVYGDGLLKGKQLVPDSLVVASGDPRVSSTVEVDAEFQVGKDIRKRYLVAFQELSVGTRDNPRWLVTGVKVKKRPRVHKRKKRRKPKKFQKGMKPELVKTEVAKDGRVVETHPLVPLGHLEDTPQELRDEIDRLIDVVANPEARPKEVTKAINRLIEIGRPAMPRILNLFYEIHNSDNPDSYDNRTILARIINRCLWPMTRCQFGYDPSMDETDRKEGAKKRLKVLQEYYAWWYRHFDKAYWELLKKKREAEENDGL